jgi:DNA mismatch endonuclease (patch repair protein)
MRREELSLGSCRLLRLVQRLDSGGLYYEDFRRNQCEIEGLGSKRKQMKFSGHPSGTVSNRMSRVRSRETGLEKAMELILKSMHLKFERQPRLEGHPDFRIVGSKVLLFCDSSFWHGRREQDLRGESFRVRRDYWTNKLRYNRERDKRVTGDLREKGWNVIRVWDSTILRRPNAVRARIERALNEPQ